MNNSQAISVVDETYNPSFHSSYGISLESFEIIKVVGRGSFGKVYLVRKRDTGGYYALKSLKKDYILRK